jgi:hypothetical protein
MAGHSASSKRYACRPYHRRFLVTSSLRWRWCSHCRRRVWARVKKEEEVKMKLHTYAHDVTVSPLSLLYQTTRAKRESVSVVFSKQIVLEFLLCCLVGSLIAVLNRQRGGTEEEKRGVQHEGGCHLGE